MRCAFAATARPGVVVVFYPSAALVHVAAVLALASGGGTKSIELGVELRLRLDEAATVVAHGLVAGIWVLREEGDTCCHQDNDEQDKRECSVDNEKHDTHDTSNNTLEVGQQRICTQHRRKYLQAG